MPRVKILPVDLATAVAPGETLLDAGHNAGVEMEADCCHGTCGACVVAIVEGGENLTLPGVEELAVLHAHGCDPARHRLACSARVLRGAVVIRQME